MAAMYSFSYSDGYFYCVSTSLGFFFFIIQVDICAWLSLRNLRLPGPPPSLPGFDLTFSSSPDFIFQGVELLDHGPGPFGEQDAEARIFPSTLVSSLCGPAWKSSASIIRTCFAGVHGCGRYLKREFLSDFLYIQVHAFVKASGLSLRAAGLQGEVRSRPTSYTSMVLTQGGPGFLSKSTWRGGPVCQDSLTFGSAPGGMMARFESYCGLWRFVIWPGICFVCMLSLLQQLFPPFQIATVGRALWVRRLPMFP